MKRILSLALILSLLAVSFAACGSDDAEAPVTASGDAGTAETAAAETGEPRIDPGLPERDFEGYNFRVLTKGTTNVHWKSRDIAAEAQNGEPINDAVYARNLKVGEQYNFTFLDVPCQDYSNIPGEASKLVLAGDTSIDMFCFNVASLITDLYLIPQLREEYGVYTPLHFYDSFAGSYLISYRDPNIGETFAVYDSLADQLRAYVEDDGVLLAICGGYQICGKECDWNDWEADHIVPWSKGGKTEIENGPVLCPTCNSKKSNNL